MAMPCRPLNHMNAPVSAGRVAPSPRAGDIAMPPAPSPVQARSVRSRRRSAWLGLVVQRAAEERLDEVEVGGAEPEKFGARVGGDRLPGLPDGGPGPVGQVHQHAAPVRRVTDPFGQAGPLQPVDRGGGGTPGEARGGGQLARGERAARGQPAQASQIGAVDAETPRRQLVDEVGGVLQLLNGPGHGLDARLL